MLPLPTHSNKPSLFQQALLVPPFPTLSILHPVACLLVHCQELINAAVADNAEYHRRVVDSKDEVVAERSVLEWFYLDPNKLNDHVVGVEQRIAVMRL